MLKKCESNDQGIYLFYLIFIKVNDIMTLTVTFMHIHVLKYTDFDAANSMVINISCSRKLCIE